MVFLIIFAGMRKKQLSLKRWAIVILLLVSIYGLSACHAVHFFSKTTSEVPDGKHLLDDEEITVKGDPIRTDDLKNVIRQHPNTKFIGIKWRLRIYNMVDSAKVEKKRIAYAEKIHNKNIKRKARQDRVNEKRIQKAREKGEKSYKPKHIPLKDTADLKQKFREQLKYKRGEAPVIADSFLIEKSKDQLETYLHSLGYYYGTVDATYDTLFKKRHHEKIDRKRVVANYSVTTGPRYIVDSVKLISNNSSVNERFNRFIRKELDANGLNPFFKKGLIDKQPISWPFNANELNAYRDELAKYMRDGQFFGFTATNVYYVVDTIKSTMKINLTIKLTDRLIPVNETSDSLVPIQFKETWISGVYFHICDTSLFEGDFQETLKQFSIFTDESGFVPTLDTLFYDDLLKKVEDKAASAKAQEDGHKNAKIFYKSKIYKNLFGQYKDSIAKDPLRMASFYYNGELFVNPALIEAQNYLEFTNSYKDYYFDRTYTRLVQLGLFSTIRPELIERVPGSGKLEVHYFLVPAKRQSVMLQPRAVYSNGYLGINASVNYFTKNLFKTGTNMTISMSGGYEANPNVLEDSITGRKLRFNTFQIGPSIKFDIPGLFPFSITKLGKRQRPRTTMSMAYNYESRTDFKRGVLQFNYLYNFWVGDGKTQVVTFGFPLMSVIKLVNYDPTKEFDQKINELSDLFIRNAYSSQLIWEDFRINYEYDNLEAAKKTKNLRFTFTASFNTAGSFLNLVSNKTILIDSNSYKTAFGIPFSQFSLLDSKMIWSFNLTKRLTWASRAQFGYGLPGKNSSTSLPYDYSFSGGGSNDIRAWEARSLGPGSYCYLLDSNSIKTQIGDIRIGASTELRIGSNGLFKHALFFDIGNIWTKNKDPLREGGQFSKDFYKQFAFAAGYGLRLDFTYFIFRVDIGFPIYNPTIPDGSRWFFQSKDAYFQKAEELFGANYANLLQPYQKFFRVPKINFGIGLPF